MSRYRRSLESGATFFFTVALADRNASTLTDHIEALRASYRAAEKLRPFETLAICVLPDHLHAIWELPQDDADFSTRWSQIKAGFHAASRLQQGAVTANAPSARKASGNDDSGNIEFAMTTIYNGMWIISITTR